MANLNNERAFDWDDTIENDGGAFTLLPEGNYPFTVEKFERGEFSGSDKMPPCKKAIVTLIVDGGALGSVTITENLFLHSRAEWKLCEFFTCVGLRQRGEPLKMPWQQVAGRRGMCKLIQRKWCGNDGAERSSNSVEHFLEPSAASQPYESASAAHSPTPAPSPAPAPTSWQPGSF